MKKFIVKKNQTIVLDESGDFQVEITQPGAEAEIVGSFLTQNQDKVDINLTIIHKAPHTRANTMLKGVAKDQSSIRLFGRIIIDPGCGDTQSFLEERILLLSDQAKAEAVPELEILADDVKCSHAASVSKIPDEHMFYLQSRGLSKEKAEEVIVEGFLEI